MATRSSRVTRWLTASLIGFLGLAVALSAPETGLADTDLAIGGSVLIADAQGDPVRLRDAPWGDVIAEYAEGTSVAVLDGPFQDDDGSSWYYVDVDGSSGYMIADYLSAGGSSGGTTVLDDLNLRAGPSTGHDVLAVMAAGDTVSVNGDPVNGFYPVSFGGTDGWAFGGYLDGFGGGGSDTLTVQEDLNLRTGPSTSEDVLLVMAAGAEVALTGLSDNGFLSVVYDGMDGWAAADYLGDGFSGSGAGEILFTNDWLNLRAGPSTGDGVLSVMAPGAEVEVVGGLDSGFYQVLFDGQSGWAFADFLGSDPGSSPSGGGNIIWPISGGEWEITQGYNGPFSHFNADSTYQYAHAFDLARTDGNTAGQPVYSPVNGSVRWTEVGSGGISIDMGNGYALAMFHLTLDSGLSWGDSVSQGQYLGTISGPGGNGYMGFAHVHLTLWATEDGGNWSRVSAPFSGANAISGVDFPETGGSNQHAGTVFYP